MIDVELFETDVTFSDVLLVPCVFTEPEIDSGIMQSAKTNFDIQNK